MADGRQVTLSLELFRGGAIPGLPPCHLRIATDIFEHLHTPLQAFEAIDQALLPGELFVTDVHE